MIQMDLFLGYWKDLKTRKYSASWLVLLEDCMDKYLWFRAHLQRKNTYFSLDSIPISFCGKLFFTKCNLKNNGIYLQIIYRILENLKPLLMGKWKGVKCVFFLNVYREKVYRKNNFELIKRGVQITNNWIVFTLNPIFSMIDAKGSIHSTLP